MPHTTCALVRLSHCRIARVAMATLSSRTGCCSRLATHRQRPLFRSLDSHACSPSPCKTLSRMPASGLGIHSHGQQYLAETISRQGVVTQVWPFDQAWAPSPQSLAPQLFAFSLFPYLAFLFFLTKTDKVPRLTLIGFYFLLAFVGATIPAGIYAKVHYGTSLANVDWLHGSAESLLTVTNLFIVLGLRQGIREAEQQQQQQQQQQEAQQLPQAGEVQALEQKQEPAESASPR